MRLVQPPFAADAAAYIAEHESNEEYQQDKEKSCAHAPNLASFAGIVK
jgi:hypothetical protein